MDLSGDPVAATQWDIDTGHSWLIPSATDDNFVEMTSDFSAILDDVSCPIDKKLWAKASQHEAAEDLKHGADLMHVSREIERFAKADEHGQVGLTIAVTTGGQWPRARLRAAGYEVAPTCARCGLEEETLYHRIWSCPMNCGHKDYDDSSCLVEEARINHVASPSLWLRG
eukprot:7904802-Pyramimonas_sp.AAC.1